MHKTLLASSLALLLLTLSFYACQKQDASYAEGTSTHEALLKIPTVPDAAQLLGADDRECSTCRGKLIVSTEDEGSYTITIESRPCATSNWANPVTFAANAYFEVPFQIGHALQYRLTIKQPAKSPARSFSSTIENPTPYAPLVIESFNVGAGAQTVKVLYPGRGNCGCLYQYDCDEDQN